ncbi:hypothetical protein [Thermus sp.]|uniref:PstC family ABC transporter permease n=1 Tax=Thermus sp. TaxID=275 RepID=UPI00298F2D0E|nr:hypothetical protein [Thermus sp.]MDW8358838.1 hypothetical protein [Thermus sp.]
MGRGRLSGDGAFLGGMVLLGALVPLLALLMAYALYRGASLALGQMGFANFVLGERWDPVAGVFGAWPYILGTLLVSFSALLLSLLPALAIALLSAEYAPKGVARALDLALDLMAAVPSVVYGLWGVLVLAPWLRNTVELPLYAWAAAHAPALASFLGVPTGYGLLTAILLLASMVIPFSAAVARHALAQVPAELRQAAYALEPPIGRWSVGWPSPRRGRASWPAFSWPWPGPWGRPWP